MEDFEQQVAEMIREMEDFGKSSEEVEDALNYYLLEMRNLDDRLNIKTRTKKSRKETKHCATPREEAELQQWVRELWRCKQPVKQSKVKWRLKHYFSLMNTIEAADDDAKVMQILQEFDFDNQSDTMKANALNLSLLGKIKDAPLFQTIFTLDGVNCFKTLIQCIPLSVVDLDFTKMHVDKLNWADDSDISWYILYKGKAAWNMDHNVDVENLEDPTEEEKLRILQKMASIVLAAELFGLACQFNATKCLKFLLEQAPSLIFTVFKDQNVLKAISTCDSEIKILIQEHMDTVTDTMMDTIRLNRTDEARCDANNDDGSQSEIIPNHENIDELLCMLGSTTSDDDETINGEINSDESIYYDASDSFCVP